jgi:hypothetical protein
MLRGFQSLVVLIFRLRIFGKTFNAKDSANRGLKGCPIHDNGFHASVKSDDVQKSNTNVAGTYIMVKINDHGNENDDNSSHYNVNSDAKPSLNAV